MTGRGLKQLVGLEGLGSILRGLVCCITPRQSLASPLPFQTQPKMHGTIKTDSKCRPHAVNQHCMAEMLITSILTKRSCTWAASQLPVGWSLQIQSCSAHNACTTEMITRPQPGWPRMHALCSGMHMNIAFSAIPTNNVTCQVLILQDAPHAAVLQSSAG